MSPQQLNRFLRWVRQEPSRQQVLRVEDPQAIAAMAQQAGFEVSVGDLIRHQGRATSWQLRDDELEEVARWQAKGQPYWWRLIWDA